MKSDRPTDPLVPAALLREIEVAAADEQRAPSELVAEAIERYLSERRWLCRGEVHAKVAQGLASLQRGEGVDGEVVIAELLAELDAPAPGR